jgi:hypothetical protein
MLSFIPMPNSVSIQKSTELDAWGIAVASPESTEYVCKVTYNSKKESIAIASGESVVFTASILFDGVPDIDYPDFVIFQDDRGRELRKQPLEIAYKHDYSGTPVMLKVTV